MKTPAHHDKPIVGFLCVIIAFALLLVISQNQDNFLGSNNLPIIMIMSTLVLGLLLGLFYMVSNRVDAHVAKSTKSHKPSKSKKKKR